MVGIKSSKLRFPFPNDKNSLVGIFFTNWCNSVLVFQKVFYKLFIGYKKLKGYVPYIENLIILFYLFIPLFSTYKPV